MVVAPWDLVVVISVSEVSQYSMYCLPVHYMYVHACVRGGGTNQCTTRVIIFVAILITIRSLDPRLAYHVLLFLCLL